MTRRILASLVIALSVLAVPALAWADDLGGGGVPVFLIPPGTYPGGGGGGSTCFLDYAYCMDRASNLPTWWERSAAGLDCTVDLTACIRKTVL
jgi:hypothetical protein